MEDLFNSIEQVESEIPNLSPDVAKAVIPVVNAVKTAANEMPDSQKKTHSIFLQILVGIMASVSSVLGLNNAIVKKVLPSPIDKDLDSFADTLREDSNTFKERYNRLENFNIDDDSDEDEEDDNFSP